MDSDEDGGLRIDLAHDHGEMDLLVELVLVGDRAEIAVDGRDNRLGQ